MRTFKKASILVGCTVFTFTLFSFKSTNESLNKANDYKVNMYCNNAAKSSDVIASPKSALANLQLINQLATNRLLVNQLQLLRLRMLDDLGTTSSVIFNPAVNSTVQEEQDLKMSSL